MYYHIIMEKGLCTADVNQLVQRPEIFVKHKHRPGVASPPSLDFASTKSISFRSTAEPASSIAAMNEQIFTLI